MLRVVRQAAARTRGGLVACAGLRASVARLDPVWQAEVDRLVPSVASAPPSDAGSRAVIDAWHRHRFFDGLSRALFGADRPLLLVLDNVQWCDAETLAFLLFSLGIADGANVMLLVTLRSEARSRNVRVDTAGPLHAPVDRNHASGRSTPRTPLPSHRHLRSGLAETDAALLHAATGGFPLFVVEAARSLGESRTSLPVGT